MVGMVALGLALAGGLPARGQDQLPGADGERPLEINADEGIEWRRDTNQYIARGNARAAQGDLEVFADVLTANYRPGADGGSEIYQIDALGNVRIVTPDQNVTADKARYDVNSGLMMLTGDNLRMETGQDVITARDSMEYWEKQNVAVARGNAVALREDKRVRADLLTAYMLPNEDEDLEIDRVDLNGNVEVSSSTEYARGNKAVYYVKREFATLSGNVRITRGDNQLNGEYAEVDMAAGVSRLRSAAPGGSSGDRVRGLIVPQGKSEADSGS